MKKALFIVAVFSILHAPFYTLHSQVVREDSFQRLEVFYRVPELQLLTHPFGDVKTFLPVLEGYRSDGRIGAPVLPVRSDFIVVPFCDSIVVTVTDVIYDTIHTFSHSCIHTFSPLQRPRSKSAVGEPVVDYDTALYAADAFFGLPLVTVSPVGIARDRRLAHLRFSPLRVNPVTGDAILCRSATVTVTYIGADIDHTLDHYRRYHTPAYSTGTTLNSLFSAKDAALTTPLRMVIAVGSGLTGNSRLNDFADWKRSQGMLVDFIYADSIPGFTSQRLADSLCVLYNAATEEYPAPLYVILVGDHEQLPAFDYRLSNDNWVLFDHFSPHITDHYFATWTADNIRDCYLGRFSATDVAELDAIIDKTLLYERYLFADDSYLSKAVLVSGIDGSGSYDWAINYADPSMDYVAGHYVNSDLGFQQVTYCKNNTSINPRAPGVTVASNTDANRLLNLYDQGMGYVNYSAHGSATSWTNPAFTVSHVNAMNNYGKPSVIMGNCCLSNHFQTPVCLGEALLRKASAGAAAYIGATNSTYWDDDFFFSVGYRVNVSPAMDLSYNSTFTGCYDHLFHLHNEAPAVTIGGMMQAGLMAVNGIYDLDSYGHDMVPYYWEIYELMGDPSLIPWLGRAAEPVCSIDTTGDGLSVITVPGAYVALFDSTHTFLATVFADASGLALFDLSSLQSPRSTLLLSVTAQHHKPYLNPLDATHVGFDQSLSLPASRTFSIFPNPATDRVTVDGLSVGSRIELYDAKGRHIHTFSLSPCHPETYSLDVSSLPSGIYFLRTDQGAPVQKLIKK